MWRCCDYTAVVGIIYPWASRIERVSQCYQLPHSARIHYTESGRMRPLSSLNHMHQIQRHDQGGSRTLLESLRPEAIEPTGSQLIRTGNGFLTPATQPPTNSFRSRRISPTRTLSSLGYPHNSREHQRISLNRATHPGLGAEDKGLQLST